MHWQMGTHGSYAVDPMLQYMSGALSCVCKHLRTDQQTITDRKPKCTALAGGRGGGLSVTSYVNGRDLLISASDAKQSGHTVPLLRGRRLG